VLLYRWILARKRRSTVRLASVEVARLALGKGPGWRRHVPPLLLLGALAALLLSLARPTATIRLPLAERTIILAMDVSGSMRAEDVKPNRLAASQQAAKAFVENLPREVKVGVVSFAGTAAVVQAPTTSRDDVMAAIDRFQLQRGTATGSGIILSLATLFPDDGIEIQHITGQRRFPGTDIAKKQAKPFTPVPPGSYNSAAVIMLTDGQRTTGPDPLDAAKMAAERGVRVYTVGIGTTQGEVIGFEGWSMRVRLDEETLKNVSVLTHGEYFYAGTAEDLKKVYEGLSSRMVVERKETEITALFAALGALLRPDVQRGSSRSSLPSLPSVSSQTTPSGATRTSRMRSFVPSSTGSSPATLRPSSVKRHSVWPRSVPISRLPFQPG
jgi:Ca-activated chloride channel family protein